MVPTPLDAGKVTFSVKVPVQLEFTVYMPAIVNEYRVPFPLSIAVPVVLPFPSKNCVPTSAIVPAPAADAAVVIPLDVYAKVPCKLKLLHPLTWAFAVGAMPRASAVIAAIVKAFAIMTISLEFPICLPVPAIVHPSASICAGFS
jgi:hypothetical protein